MKRSQRWAASFVVTLAAIPACTRGTRGTTSEVVRRSDGSCWRTYSTPCPEGASCNPPPPVEVDCATGEKLPPPAPARGSSSSAAGQDVKPAPAASPNLVAPPSPS
ncbi:MAG TPA: hypothetical protein PKD61_02885 [Polyangiaceae bacterium]|nr:hypothetical protein [Polyangiaceae bacterium]